MEKKRLYYLPVIAGVVVLGILSRQFSFIPLFVGDVFYAVMVYYFMRFVLINRKLVVAALIGLLCCFVVEIAQLYRGEWIVEVRNTPFGHYALGHCFRWSDLLAYAVGSGLAVLVDKLLLSSRLK